MKPSASRSTLLLKCQWLAMRDYQKFINENSKVGALRLVAEFHAKLMTLLQTTGLVREVPKKLILEDFNPFEDEEFTQEFDAIISEGTSERHKNLRIMKFFLFYKNG